MKRRRPPGIIRQETDPLKKFQTAIVGRPMSPLESAVLLLRNIDPNYPEAFKKLLLEEATYRSQTEFLKLISQPCIDTDGLRRLADLLENQDVQTNQFFEPLRAKILNWKFLLNDEAVTLKRLAELLNYTGNPDVLRKTATDAGFNLIKRPVRQRPTDKGKSPS